MDNLDYLFAAFAIVWTGIFGYILFLSRKQQLLQREIESLEARVHKGGSHQA